MISENHSVFNSFNARSLTVAEVARTFVPSDHFDRLCRKSHAIVVGPRGSGKTTLLKMLQPAAIECWPHKDADAYWTQLSFTGVFIATDISWSMQLRTLGAGLLEGDLQQLLGAALFTTHVLRSFVVSLQQRMGRYSGATLREFRRLGFDSDTEARLTARLCAGWMVTPIVSTLLSLKQALSLRMSEIRTLAGSLSQPIHIGRVSLNDERFQFLNLNFLQSITTAIEFVGAETRQEEERWGLLFDELEIAPEWIREELFSALRSTDERIVFKLALSPFATDQHLKSFGTLPVAGEDFEQIALWYSERRDAIGFCRSLWEQMMRERNLGNIDPKDVLGSSWFDESRPELKSSNFAGYGPRSKWFIEFSRLRDKDRSFSSYLKRNAVNLSELDQMPEGERAAKIRKVAPLVAYRNFYRADKDRTVGGVNAPALRSRKSTRFYTGSETLFALTEGNPRWFIAMMSRILDKGQGTPLRVDRDDQAGEVLAAAQRFAASLRTIPLDVASGQQEPILAYLKRIAKYFRDSALKEDFSPDLHGCFHVDQKTPEQIVKALSIALNAGAIVYLNAEDGQFLLPTLRERNFRLSYLLAPLYNFPLRTGKPISLSTVLGQGQALKGQPSLFKLDDTDESE